MEGAPLHCSRRPRTRHGPSGPLIHHGCPRPRIYHGRLNSLPRFLKPNVLSLPLVSPFPLGPSLGQGSLLRPGGRLSRLLRPGGRLSRLLRPGGRLSRLLRPGGRLSRLLRPGGRLSRLLRPGGRLSCLLRPGGRLSRLLRPSGRLSRLLRPGGRLICQSHSTSPSTCQSHSTSPSTCQSHSTSPSTCQSHSTSPSTCQSHSTSPSTCQSHPTSPPTCQSHPTPPPTCQSHLTSQRSTQYPFTSLLSRPPCPGGLLSHWPHMDLALHSLPRFHLRSTALLDWGSVMNLVATHSNCTSPIDYISHHALHSHIPVHHYTNHTAVTIHSLVLIVSPHLHLIYSHTYKQHTYSPIAKSCFPLANISERSSYSSCYLCVSPRTAWPWISEPVPVTPTSAWYCLRLCPASDIPVFACWPCLFDSAF